MWLSAEQFGELEYLDVVRCRDLVPLTLTNPLHVERLAALLDNERALRHPLVTVKLAGRRVVLDGNARLAAAMQLDLPDILVQDIPLDRLPNPLILPRLAVLNATEKQISLLLERELLPDLESSVAALRVLLRSGGCLAAYPSEEAPENLWNLFTHTIHGLRSLTDLLPLPSPKGGLDSNRWPDGVSAVVVPPPLSIDTLSWLVESQIRLPWGVLGSPPARRILGINLSLDVLCAPEPASEKAAFVRELVRLRLSERRVQYYDAPVYIFEE
jgi:hypothetical protein